MTEVLDDSYFVSESFFHLSYSFIALIRLTSTSRFSKSFLCRSILNNFVSY
jgi:hypothetical protein